MDKYDITNANITTMNIKTLLGLVKSRILSLWNKKFNLRLKVGHFIAMLFRKDKTAAVLLQILKRLPFLFNNI